LAEADAILSELTARDPGRTSWQRDRAIVESYRARALLAAGRTRDARLRARRAVDTLRSVSSGGDSTSRRLLTESLLILGDAEATAGDTVAAREARTRAFDTIHLLAATSADPLVLELYARALTHLGRTSEAAAVAARLAKTGYRRTDLTRGSLALPHPSTRNLNQGEKSHGRSTRRHPLQDRQDGDGHSQGRQSRSFDPENQVQAEIGRSGRVVHG
jgi:hypothetical protein